MSSAAHERSAGSHSTGSRRRPFPREWSSARELNAFTSSDFLIADASTAPHLLPQHPRLWWRRIGRLLLAADRLVRLHFLCFTQNLVLLGAASVTATVGLPAPNFGVILQLLVVAWLFHGFAYVLNDVIDLPIDRTQPQRAKDPLVRGELDVRWVLALALATIPAACFQTWCLGGSLEAQLVLLGAFAAMAIYNLWGKRCFFPPLTDLAQGLGWGGLVFWAALTLGETLTSWTWVAGLLAILYIFLINGVHGGLRDLENDLQTGSRTTAIFFGAKPRPSAQRGSCPATMTVALAAFATLGQLMTLGVIAWGASLTTLSWPMATLLGGVCLVQLEFLRRVLLVQSPTWQRDFRLHLFLLLLPPVILFSPALPPGLLVTSWLALFAPVVFFDITHELVRDAWAYLTARLARP